MIGIRSSQTRTRRLRHELLAGVCAAGILAATQVPTPAAAVDEDARPADQGPQSRVLVRQAAFDATARVATAEGEVRVTLILADAPDQAPTAKIRSRLEQQARTGLAATLRALDGPAGTSSVPGAPAMTALVSAADVAALREEPAVRSIAPTVELEPAGTSRFGAATGVQLPKWWHQKRIGLDWTYANRYNGAGQKVVIVDTGVDSTHPWLTGRVVGGACFSQGGCGNGLHYKYGTAAGGPCRYAPSCAHGTHVAHIAAGAHGAARSAGIVAINASTRGVDRNGNPAPRFWDADLINALWYSYHHVNPAPAAVNLSIGSDSVYSAVCDSSNPTMASWITSLRSRGTATVIAAGNGDSAAGVSSPACMSSAVVVGNATLTGRTGVPAVLGGVWGGSNSHALVDLWAPGTDICSAVPRFLDRDGAVDGVDCSYYGTSMAAPQVAGAFAVLRSARPTYTVAMSLNALARNGLAVTDSRNNVTRSLISISNAVYYG